MKALELALNIIEIIFYGAVVAYIVKGWNRWR